MGVVRTILSGDALYYYYKPEYLDFVADQYRFKSYYYFMLESKNIISKIEKVCFVYQETFTTK